MAIQTEKINPTNLLNIEGKLTTSFILDYVNYLQNAMIGNLIIQNPDDPEKSNLIDVEIWLLEELLACCPIMTIEIIMTIYSVFSFFFDFQSEYCPLEVNKYGRIYKFPEFDVFHFCVFFYKFENEKPKYLYKHTDYCNEIDFVSFDEIFNEYEKMSIEFVEFLNNKLIEPLKSKI